ncbi:MAG: acetolactate synthase small subunit [Chloroflexi bacterium]|nr:acetolactate synthase small subunit [Chloroflexota bacterium]
MKHTLVALVENKPGVLVRVAGMFRRRNFNIESLTVGHTEDPALSRMTIVVDGDQTDITQVERNLGKLVAVVGVSDLTHAPSVMRDLALIKVEADGAARAEIMQLTQIYRAKIVDVAHDSVVIEVTGTEPKVDSLVELFKPFGIVEMVRTGRVAMARGIGSSGLNGNGHEEF